MGSKKIKIKVNHSQNSNVANTNNIAMKTLFKWAPKLPVPFIHGLKVVEPVSTVL